MLKRKITSVLEEWYQTKNRPALCIIGARQIGKTTSVCEFAGRHYKRFLKLDFLNSRQAAQIFENAEDVEGILAGLAAFSSESLIPGETLVLLDEIQECPQARTAIKYLVEDGRYDYIETGSLLGVKIRQVKSMPVGFEKLVSMYPLDFEEFAWAMKIPEEVIEYLEKCWKEKKPVAAGVHQRMLRLFRLYLAIGGMPKAVAAFVQSQNVKEASEIQQQLLDLYRLDISQYSPEKDRVRIQNVYKLIPSQIEEKNPRFFLANVSPKARMKQYEPSLVWLIESGTVLPSYSVSAIQKPLMAYAKRSLFRLFMSDTGMLCRALDPALQNHIVQGDPDINLGSIMENCFAQQFVANGFELYYFYSKAYGEIDFVLENPDGPVVAEIKSGREYRRHHALDRVLQSEVCKGSRAVVFCQDPGSEENGIEYLPWYMVMFLLREIPQSVQTDFNWENLDFPK